MHGEYFAHQGICPVVAERRTALGLFYFAKKTEQHNKGVRRLSKLARLWAMLLSVIGLGPKKESVGQ
jgi:hypothetical protein